MAWLRYARAFMPVILHAIDVASRVLEDKQAQRRFLKEWVARSTALMGAVLEEMEDQLDDMDEDTSEIEQGHPLGRGFADPRG